ncbi:MAG: hypothetical protein ACRC5H_02720 [Treponemataceae bacterium]|uniref:hypothetical protein n=1 Tax=Eubacterium aggregans TaxID=81409 RepID=UPI003F3C63C9
MCKALKFARSTYYEALVRIPSNKEKEYQRFSIEVKESFEKSVIVLLRSTVKLIEKGIPCSIKRVQLHIQCQGLRSVVVKKYNYKANQGKVSDNKENVLNRDFMAETINQKRVTDITYIYVLREGWTYRASVMDLYDRKIIGYVYGKNMTADLALGALKNACLT